MWFLVLVNAFVVVAGILQLVAPGLAWKMAELSNSFQGDRPERSLAWEIGRAIGGIVCIIVGLVFLIVVARQLGTTSPSLTSWSDAHPGGEVKLAPHGAATFTWAVLSRAALVLFIE